MKIVYRRVKRLVDELDARRVLIAYSGGVDSIVLLHAALRFRARNGVEIIAVHVHHGLSSAADGWERRCRRRVRQWGAPFLALRVDAAARGGNSPEEAARHARYAALKGLLRDGDVLMTAHQRDDQAETVLLQLLRGAGPEGLAGMPAYTRFGRGHLARPLLDVAREEIEQYARKHRLEWIEDPANNDLRYDRSYLRRRVVPVLSKRWPAWRDTVARVARHQGEARDLVLRIAREGCLQCLDGDDALSVERCRALPEAERKAVLRYWIGRCNLPTPSERQLLNLIAVLLSGAARSGALVTWPGAEVRHYRGRLYAMAPTAPPTGVGARRWLRGTDLEMSEINVKLSWRELVRRAPELGDADSLTVRLRCGGEKAVVVGKLDHLERGFHKRLKKVFQELGVPPWERDCVPLVYLGDELRLVWSPDRLVPPKSRGEGVI